MLVKKNGDECNLNLFQAIKPPSAMRYTHGCLIAFFTTSLVFPFPSITIMQIMTLIFFLVKVTTVIFNRLLAHILGVARLSLPLDHRRLELDMR